VARARNIKPGFFQNEDLAELSFEARLLYIGLWTMADREGRMEYRPKRIKAVVFPYDDFAPGKIEKLLEQLRNNRFLHVYGSDPWFIWIPTFVRHQNPHKNERDSELPAYDPNREITGALPILSVPLGLNPSPESPLLNPETTTPNPECSGVVVEDAPQGIMSEVFDAWQRCIRPDLGSLEAQRLSTLTSWLASEANGLLDEDETAQAIIVFEIEQMSKKRPPPIKPLGYLEGAIRNKLKEMKSSALAG
jgi:hypothetical protein